MAYDLFTKKQTPKDWSMGAAPIAPVPQAPAKRPLTLKQKAVGYGILGALGLGVVALARTEGHGVAQVHMSAR